jgi:pimeloyl-ACP methyl ester carboxylesterase
MQRPPPAFTLERVASKDGSRLTYRQLGEGPGLILLHGGLQAAQNLMALASALSDAFTVFVPNRRGRDVARIRRVTASKPSARMSKRSSKRPARPAFSA